MTYSTLVFNVSFIFYFDDLQFENKFFSSAIDFCSSVFAVLISDALILTDFFCFFVPPLLKI